MGRTALLEAAVTARDNVCSILLENGADVNACGSDGRTALHLAADPVTLVGNHAPCAKLAIARILLVHRANLRLLDEVGQTALDVAVANGFDACRELLRDTCKERRR